MATTLVATGVKGECAARLCVYDWMYFVLSNVASAQLSNLTAVVGDVRSKVVNSKEARPARGCHMGCSVLSLCVEGATVSTSFILSRQNR